MGDSLTIFGTAYTGVNGIKCKGTGNGTLTYIRPQGTKSISANGTGIDVAAYATVDVSVSGGGSANLQSKSVSYTPSETAQSETVSPDSGYDGLSSVAVSVGAVASDYVGSGITRRSSSDLTASGGTVTVPTGYYASSASKSVASGSLVPTAIYPVTPAITVDGNGLVTASVEQSGNTSPVYTSGWIGNDATQYVTVNAYNTQQLPAASQFAGMNPAYVTKNNARKWVMTSSTVVDPEEGGSAGWLAEGVYPGITLTYDAVPANTTVTPTTSSQTIGGANHMMEGPVTVSAMPSGTAGTPTATKGTVSNHSVSVTPSVTNSSGYISGGTKTGTAVTVSASELVSGSETKTANGTYNVTNLASLVVAVPIVTYYTSSSNPTSSQGSDGDIWLVTS